MDKKPSLLSQVRQRVDTPGGRRMLLLVTALIAALLFFQSIKPAMSQKSEASKARQALSKKTETTKKEIAALAPQLEKQKTSNLSASLNTALPATNVADQQLAVLSRLAEQTNVELPTFEPSEPDGVGTTYQVVPANLAIKGSLENCLRFVSGLNSLVTVKGEDQVRAYGPIWNVSQLALAPGGVKNQVSITLTSGYYIEGTDTQKKQEGQ